MQLRAQDAAAHGSLVAPEQKADRAGLRSDDPVDFFGSRAVGDGPAGADAGVARVAVQRFAVHDPEMPVDFCIIAGGAIRWC